MLRITPCIVRVKSISFSLYIVMQISSSVSREVKPMFWRSLYPRSTKSSGSQVTAVYNRNREAGDTHYTDIARPRHEIREQLGISAGYITGIT